MKSRLIVLLAVAFLVSGVAAYAHHSFAGSYVEDKLITIQGKVVEFSIRNPHSFIGVEVTGKDGKVVRWGGEWGGVTQLQEGNVTKFSLKYGDIVTIEGAPPRDAAEPKLLVRKVHRDKKGDTPEFNWGGTVR
jgi:hypothetical protein